MSRYFLELSYNGASYIGWQSQPSGGSVQQEIEGALSTLLKTPIAVVGAGRTDSGVHASFYVAHFDSPNDEKTNHPDFLYHLNCVLSGNIAVSKMYVVDSGAHARFDAKWREYKYIISTVKEPFAQKMVTLFHGNLDVEAMNRAALLLLSTTDFTSFAKLHTDTKTNNCKVRVARWNTEGNRLIFTIEADRFLRSMVRSVVGTLLNVGRGKLSIEQFAEIIAAKDRSKASSSALADGLYLTNIIY